MLFRVSLRLSTQPRAERNYPTTGKNQPYDFETQTDTEYEEFEELKRFLVSPPILTLPRYGRKYALKTDACGDQVGCAFLQEPDAGTRPIGYWSCRLTDAERNYATTEKECLAVIWIILTLRPYLYRGAFNQCTDHEALRWVLNLADSFGRLRPLRLRLAEYNYEVQYRPGVKHQVADGVSRLRTDGGDTEPVDDEVPCFVVQYEDGSEPLLDKVHWDPPQDRKTQPWSSIRCEILRRGMRPPGVQHYFTTVYCPPSNGRTERFNHTLVQAPRQYVEENQRDWDD